MDKNCGTCKWWSAGGTKLPNGKRYSNCTFVMPASVEHVVRFQMLDTEGANCPVWEKKGLKPSDKGVQIGDNNTQINTFR